MRSLLYGLWVMGSVAVLVTTLLYLAPVDPALMTFGQMADKKAVEAKRAELGLDRPLWQQIGSALNDLSPLSWHTPERPPRTAHFVVLRIGSGFCALKWPWLRESYQNGRPVHELIAQALPGTALLAIAAMALAICIGLPLGVWAALRRGAALDVAVQAVSTLGISLPGYVAGILLAYVFGVLLSEQTGLDPFGAVFDFDDYGEPTVVWSNLILPAVALGMRPVALIAQLSRGSMIETLSQDFVRTARAKGLSPASVFWKHALRNALTPVLTATSGWFAALLTGAVFVERVFAYPGLGNTLVEHLLAFDIPVVLGISLFMATVFLTVNALTDRLYVFLDPRSGR
jgi:peptide/nickel transport system permease protein